jgi:hypothetical protein
MDAWIDRYEKSNQNPINRAFHTFGIPMIAVSIPLFLIAPLVLGFRKIPLSLFTAGWICFGWLTFDAHTAGCRLVYFNSSVLFAPAAESAF